jgi:hypothetical protein
MVAPKQKNLQQESEDTQPEKHLEQTAMPGEDNRDE